jgi:NitT/TauT family transport system permease protein
VLIHAPKTNFVFGIFIGCDSRARLRPGLSPRPETYLYRGVFYSGISQLAGVWQEQALALHIEIMKPSFTRWLGLLSILLGFLAWEVIVRVSGLPKFILPSPLDVWTRLLRALADGSLLLHTGYTLIEIILGLFFGVLFATVIGWLLAKSRSLEKILSPYLVASQAIPIVAIAPLLILWFGSGITSKVLICSLIVFFPVLVNTIVGIRAVPATLYDLMNSVRATRWQILFKLELPASLPVLLGGLRIGATLSVIGAIVGELVDAKNGLGFLLKVGDFQYDTSMVFVAVFMLVSLALMLYGMVTLLERRFLKWQK